jgi:hypothetical protein
MPLDQTAAYQFKTDLKGLYVLLRSEPLDHDRIAQEVDRILTSVTENEKNPRSLLDANWLFRFDSDGYITTARFEDVAQHAVVMAMAQYRGRKPIDRRKAWTPERPVTGPATKREAATELRSRVEDFLALQGEDLAKLVANASDDAYGSAQATYRELLQFAKDNMKGGERRIVELVCQNSGECLLANLAADSQIQWSTPYDDAFNSARTRINDKLNAGSIPWRLVRKHNKATLRPHAAENTSKEA